MQAPNIDNLIKDPQHEITYNVRAYRTLTRTEMVQAVQVFLRQTGGRRPKRGTLVTIISVIGLNGE